MGSVEPLRRCDVVLVRTRGENIHVKRVAALAGDRFAMKNGSIVLNGVVVPQRLRRLEKTEGALGTEEVRRLVERFPGERSAHEIYDAGPGPGDDIAEFQVPPGSVVLLGDNRDRSADSRYPVEEGGFGGAVAEADIVGRPYYQSWGSSRPAGTPLFH